MEKPKTPFQLTQEIRARLFRLLDTLANLETPPRGKKAEIGAGMLATLKEDAQALRAELPAFSDLAPKPSAPRPAPRSPAKPSQAPPEGKAPAKGPGKYGGAFKGLPTFKRRED